MTDYFHSVRLVADKCQGCVTCIKRCPTEAIRVREGKARIKEAHCIDCGECILNCPTQAKKAITDNLSNLSKYKYNIALPAPTLYAQFSLNISIEMILAGLIELGFDDVFEVAIGAEIVSLAIRDFLKREDNYVKPLISTACPAVVRLVQIKFPELIEHLMPFDAPVEVAARIARNEAVKKLGIPADDIGTWFITPCPAKMTTTRSPLGSEKSNISGAIGMNQIYGQLRKAALAIPPGQTHFKQASWRGIGWAVSGGESAAIQVTDTLVVNGLNNVTDVLEQVSLSKFKTLSHIETLACAGGCIGGALVVENRHVSEYRLRQRIKSKMTAEQEGNEVFLKDYSPEILDIARTGFIEPKPNLILDEDMDKAIQKLDAVAKTLKILPGLDCGSCGSPSCKSLAEDIAQGQASETDCLFILRQKVSELAQEMVGLANKLPPPLDKRGE